MADFTPPHVDDPFLNQRLQAVNNNKPTVYIRAEDELRLSVFTSTGSLTIQLNGVVVDLKGDAKPFQMQLVTTGSGNRESVRARVGPGYILYAYPTLSGGTPAAGAVNCMLEIIQSDASTGPILYQFFYGSLTAQGFIPNIYNTASSTASATGTITAVNVANPAAGADWSKAVTAGKYWEIISIAATFTCSATVASRTPELQVRSGSDILGRAVVMTGMAANEVAKLGASPGAGYFEDVVGTTHWVNVPLPCRWATAAQTIQSATTSIQATDQWSAINLQVIEWSL